MIPDNSKEIPNFPGYYITKDGRIWSESKCRRNMNGQFLKPDLVRGYFQVTLRKSGKSCKRKISRLVLETFIKPCPNGMECCHNSGDSQDDKLSNLRWDTHSNNTKDSIKHGTHVDNRGEKCGNAKLTEHDVMLIRKLYKSKKFNQYQLANKFNISSCHISCIINRKKWKHI